MNVLGVARASDAEARGPPGDAKDQGPPTSPTGS